MCGFDNLKDVLEVIAIPLVIALIGIYLPKRLEIAKSLAREQTFTNLVRREIEEAKPFSTNEKLNKWTDHLNKRFLHESIINSANENVEFILSMPPDLIYHVSQLWIHYEKGCKATDECALANNAEQWLWYLFKTCSIFDNQYNVNLVTGTDKHVYEKNLLDTVYQPWEKAVLNYHFSLVESVKKFKKS